MNAAEQEVKLGQIARRLAREWSPQQGEVAYREFRAAAKLRNEHFLHMPATQKRET